MEKEGLVQNCAERGAQLLNLLNQRKKKYLFILFSNSLFHLLPQTYPRNVLTLAVIRPELKIGDVRGRGLMIGIELAKVEEGTAGKIAEAALRRGLMISNTGAYETLQMTPPLCVSAAECERAVQVVEESIREVLGA